MAFTDRLKDAIRSSNDCDPDTIMMKEIKETLMEGLNKRKKSDLMIGLELDKLGRISDMIDAEVKEKNIMRRKDFFKKIFGIK